MLNVPSDVIFQLVPPGRWIIHNVFTRTCLGCDNLIMNLLSDISALSYLEVETKYSGNIFQLWDIFIFNNYKGLMADPTNYIRNVGDWPEVENVDFLTLLDKLKNRFLIIDDYHCYRKRFAPKTSLVDVDHFGNFHQQLGQELIIVHRESPEEWWVKQKFSEDLLSVRDNLYGAVQVNYLENYFPRRIKPESSVVDLGCGIGFYSNMIAKTAGKVLGIDPNPKYIDIARQKALTGAQFEIAAIGKKGSLDSIPSASADFVFMSDALLFYFVPERPSQEIDIQILFADIKRILKPEGLFISMEPHYIFWLAPWLGEIDYPFTILTEYNHRNYAVTPTFSKLIQTYAEGRFAVVWMDELLPKDKFKDKYPRAYMFAKNFPLWQIIELKPF